MRYFTAKVFCDGQPAKGVGIQISETVGPYPNSKCRTEGKLSNNAGEVEFVVTGPIEKIEVWAVGYWNTVVVEPESGVKLHTSRVKISGPTGWWHECLKFGTYDPLAGSGIKIGVIDTGLGIHSTLKHAKHFLTDLDKDTRIEGFYPADREDAWGHGTSVCGLIGSRPDVGDEAHYSGIAPGVDLFCVGVPLAADASRLDPFLIANAVEFLAYELECDFINMSFCLLNNEANHVIRQNIGRALDRGCLSLCAAGNYGEWGPFQDGVCFPANLDEVICVSALGRKDVSPTCIINPRKTESKAECRGNHYVPSFSCRGDEVFCTSFGISIIGPVEESRTREIPHGGYDFLEGTSFSCPLAVGVLARILAQDSKYQEMSRDFQRAEYAKEVLRNACEPLGLPPALCGHGLPCIL